MDSKKLHPPKLAQRLLGLFLVSGGLAVVMAHIKISYQTIKSALASPVESLRFA